MVAFVSIASVRQLYNLNQGELADILGVTRSALSMAELGLRKLHPYAMKVLITLSDCINKAPLMTNAELSLSPEHKQKEVYVTDGWRRRLHIIECEINVLQLQLDKMKTDEETYGTTLNRLGVLSAALVSNGGRHSLKKK